MTPASLPYALLECTANGVRLQVAEAGDPGQPTVILLHGFPDLWQGWHFQIAALAGAGFRVLAPNQRGYGKSEKPRGIAGYDVDHLARDVVALADAYGCSTFHLVGHDWGGIVAWWTAACFPERVERLAVLNAPHPGVFQRYVVRSPTQLLRSWYVGCFQLPWLPEAVLAARNYELLFRSVRATSQSGVFDDSDREYLVAGWSQPGALTAMLNYYRAAVRRRRRVPPLRVTVPALILFGKQDPTEEPGLADASLALCDRGQVVWFADERHWIQREAPGRVNDELIRFLLPEAAR